jgi:hypothetical protein
MDKLWLNKKDFAILKTLLADCPYEVLCCGSRASGKQSSASDLDLCLKDDNVIPREYFSSLRTIFSESNFPFFVDLVEYRYLSPEFKEMTDKTSFPLKNCEPAL